MADRVKLSKRKMLMLLEFILQEDEDEHDDSEIIMAGTASLSPMSLQSCGDAMATIAASTTFTEPFVTPTDRPRLSDMHKNLAGTRCSDHVALLNAFQAWEEARMYGKANEIGFCEAESLNMQTLRVTCEAKNQLRDILINAGFPEDCLLPQMFNFHGPDTKLDMVISLLGLGLYPNVCYHKEKRKLLTMNNKSALVHKSSVNCNNQAVFFPSPFFVFGEKIRTRAVSCKQMTMVHPVQLLLFAARTIRYNGQLVIIDDWIFLKMNPETAAKIVALRPALEALVIRATMDPESISEPNPVDSELINLLQSLSKANAAQFGITEQNQGDPDGPPAKWQEDLLVAVDSAEVLEETMAGEEEEAEGLVAGVGDMGEEEGLEVGADTVAGEEVRRRRLWRQR